MGPSAGVRWLHERVVTALARDSMAFACCVCGVYTFFILFGIAQERVNTREYGGDGERASGERMTHTLVLIFLQCLTNVCFAAGALRVAGGAALRPHVEPLSLAKMAGTYIGAMFCSNAALRFISYPTQVLVKSCKMVPVMIANLLMGTRTYSLATKLRVALLTVGICAFLVGRSREHAPEPGDVPEPAGHAAHANGGAGSDEGHMQATGLALALASLVCDGYTGGAQDRLVRAVRPTAHQLMMWMNVWASGLLAVLLLLSGQGVAGARFVARHPEVLQDLGLFCLSSALGQNFIFFSIARFGALPTTVITTTRKFFTILASVLWFGHPLSGVQWCAIAIVFAALGGELSGKASIMGGKAAVSVARRDSDAVCVPISQGGAAAGDGSQRGEHRRTLTLSASAMYGGAGHGFLPAVAKGIGSRSGAALAVLGGAKSAEHEV